MFKCLLFLSLFVALTHGDTKFVVVHNGNVTDVSYDGIVKPALPHGEVLKFVVVHNNDTMTHNDNDVSDDDIVKPGFLEQLEAEAMDKLGCCGPLVATYLQQLTIAESGNLSNRLLIMALARVKVALKKKLSPFNTMTHGIVNIIIDNVIPTNSKQLAKLLHMKNSSELTAAIVESMKKIKEEAVNKLKPQEPNPDEIDKAKKEVDDLKNNPDCVCNTIIKKYKDMLATTKSKSLDGRIMSYALVAVKIGLKAELAEYNAMTLGIVFDIIDMVIPIPDTILDKILGASNIVGVTAAVIDTAVKSGVFDNVHPSQLLKWVTGKATKCDGLARFMVDKDEYHQLPDISDKKHGKKIQVLTCIYMRTDNTDKRTDYLFDFSVDIDKENMYVCTNVKGSTGSRLLPNKLREGRNGVYGTCYKTHKPVKTKRWGF